MTYKDKFKELRNDFALKTDKYIKTDKELTSEDGFFDGSLIIKLSKAKEEFQIAGNNYHSFLSLGIKNNAKADDLFSEK